MKKIGILGGISSASTLQYYKALHEMFYQQQKNYYYPEMAIESLNFQDFTDLENENRMDEYRHYILVGLENLKRAGADFAIMAANSPHSVLEEIRPAAPLPILSIVDAVGQNAQSLGLKRLLLTGIRYTMQRTFYQQRLQKYGIEVITPTSNEQDEINEIIFSELVLDVVTSASKKRFLQIIDGHPADGVVLGCTELPQLISQNDVSVPLLNSLQLHCAAALKYAIEKE